MKRSITITLLTIPLSSVASPQFNLDFIQGKASHPSILTTNNKYMKGNYYFSIFLNGNRVVKNDFTITNQDERKSSLCLSQNFLKKLNINTSKYDSYLHNGCYLIEQDKNTSIDIDYNLQTLRIEIPQIYLIKKDNTLRLEDNISSLRLNYNFNFSKNTNGYDSYYQRTKLLANFEKFSFKSDLSFLEQNRFSKISLNNTQIIYPVYPYYGDIVLGHTTFNSNLFNSFNYSGFSFRSNQEMKPYRTNGYAPIISGNATSTTRITVEQNKSIIYSTVVPSGPYNITNIPTVSSGDLTVIKTDSNGYTSRETLPLTMAMGLLRPGDYNYNLSIGKKKNNQSTDIFVAGDLSYGFNNVTLDTGFIYLPNYYSLGMGVSTLLDEYGSVGLNFNKSVFDNTDYEYYGSKITLEYNKYFNSSISMGLSAEYPTEDYVDFTRINNNIKSPSKKYKASIYGKYNGLFITSNTYLYDSPNKTIGSSLSIGFNLDNAYVNTLIRHDHRANFKNTSIMMNLSIPLSFGDSHYLSNSSISFDGYGNNSFNASISNNIGGYLNYQIGLTKNSRNSDSLTASMNYNMDSVNTGVILSSQENYSSLAGSLSGSVIMSKPTGILFSKNQNDTIGIVNIKGIKNAKFNNGVKTNSRGFAVSSLTPYKNNNISIYPNSLPYDIELIDSSFKLVPYDTGVLFRNFEYNQRHRYILALQDNNNNYLSNATAYFKGKEIGVVDPNGVLVLFTNNEVNHLTLKYRNKTCSTNPIILSKEIQNVKCI